VTAFEVAGIPIDADTARDADDGIVVFEPDGDVWVTRWRTESVRSPLVCKCSHNKSQHGTDRRGRFICYGSSVCGCIEFREKEQRP
jgi:hypothetical protein